jgi:hypothetical protein
MSTAAEMMDDATAQTGLSDFGDGSFREGLEILLASLQDEARLHEHKPCSPATIFIATTTCSR